MSEALLVYWSGTGNTEKMANLIQKGIVEAGQTAVCKNVADTKAAHINDYSVIVMGCPSMGAEVLEESEMEPFVSEIEGIIKDKKVALFGSYGWGNGEWMEDWQQRMASAGAEMLFENGLIVMEEPSGDSEEECLQYGKDIAGKMA